MNQNEPQATERLESRQLMIICIAGLHRFAQELEVCQGIEAKDKVTELHELSKEIISFWDLDDSLLEAPCEVVQQA